MEGRWDAALCGGLALAVGLLPAWLAAQSGVMRLGCAPGCWTADATSAAIWCSLHVAEFDGEAMGYSVWMGSDAEWNEARRTLSASKTLAALKRHKAVGVVLSADEDMARRLSDNPVVQAEQMGQTATYARVSKAYEDRNLKRSKTFEGNISLFAFPTTGVNMFGTASSGWGYEFFPERDARGLDALHPFEEICVRRSLVRGTQAYEDNRRDNPKRIPPAPILKRLLGLRVGKDITRDLAALKAQVAQLDAERAEAYEKLYLSPVERWAEAVAKRVSHEGMDDPSEQLQLLNRLRATWPEKAAPFREQALRLMRDPRTKPLAAVRKAMLGALPKMERDPAAVLAQARQWRAALKPLTEGFEGKNAAGRYLMCCEAIMERCEAALTPGVKRKPKWVLPNAICRLKQ